MAWRDSLHPILQEYLNDYGTEEEKAIGRQVLEREGQIRLSDSAKVGRH